MSEFKNLPSGWKVVKLGDVFDIQSGSTPSRQNFYYWENTSIYWVKTTDLNNSFISDTEEKISEIGLKESSCKVYPKNTILIAMYGGFNQIGRTGILKVEAATNQAISALLPSTKANSLFVNNILICHRNKWKNIAISSRKDPNITKRDIENFKIPLPPLDEQEKIAEILSTWDEAINLTINLIESKKQFKKALMQNLLTAKIRFLQFKDEWRAIKLSEICDISTGTSKSRFIGDGKFYIVDMGSITQDGLLNLTKTTNLNQDFLDFGDLVMPKDDIGGGKIIGKVAVIDKDNTYVLSDHIFRIKTIENSNFLAYLINSDLINKKIRREVSGTAQLGLSKRTIENLKIKLPNLKEQQKIAEVLMACDDEINLLNLKLENLKKQKQGLMQKLLSGKVKVK